MPERCAICGATIGNLERSFVLKDSIVCEACYRELSEPEASTTVNDLVGTKSGAKASPPTRGRRTRCPFCREEMDINASRCPHCGKAGGFAHAYVTGWIAVGVFVGFIIAFVAIPPKDPGGLIVSMCCGPYLVFMIPFGLVGGVIGSIHAAIAKQKINRD
jgi:hypothetical protein